MAKLAATMARPSRVDVRGGWYHVTARGNERQPIFRGDGDRRGLTRFRQRLKTDKALQRTYERVKSKLLK